MKRLLPWFYLISVTGFVLWIGWTSPTVKECLSNQYENYGSDPLQEKIGSFFGFLIGSRLCIGDFVHQNGEGIIAIFTVILGIATWFLWRATRNLVEDARTTGTKQLEVAKIFSNAAREAAENVPIVERAYVYPFIVEENIFAVIRAIREGQDPTSYIPQVEFKLKNYGKTVAFILDINGRLSCFSETPVVRDTDDWHINNAVALEPNGTTESFFSDLKPHLTKEEADGIVNGTTKLQFVGWVAIKDVWDDKRWQHFTWTWNHTKSRMVVYIPDTHVESKE
jgi:hypothetical protein